MQGNHGPSESNDKLRALTSPGQSNDVTTYLKPSNGIDNTEPLDRQEDSVYDDTLANETTPRQGRKRKLADLSAGRTSRRLSPPWKKIAVEGPTSFVENGRRKSSRTNFVPLDLQPQKGKRTTRSDLNRTPKSKPSSPSQPHDQHHTGTVISLSRGSTTRGQQNTSNDVSSPKRVLRHDVSYSRQETDRRVSKKSSETAMSTLQPQEASRRGRKPKYVVAVKPEPLKRGRKPKEVEEVKIPRLKLNLRPPAQALELQAQQQKAGLPSRIFWVPLRKYGTLEEYLQHDNALEGEKEQRLSVTQARVEASILNRLEKEHEVGGLLSDARWVGEGIERTRQVPAPYTYSDYLMNHMKDFKTRLDREGKAHRKRAKDIAEEAVRKWESRQPKSREAIVEQQRKRSLLLYKTLVQNIKGFWSAVENSILREREDLFRKEEAVRNNQEMLAFAQRQGQLTAARLQNADTTTEHDSNDENDTNTDGSEDSRRNMPDSDNDEDEELDSEEAGSSTEESEEDDQALDSDADLTAEDLRKKYNDIPSAREDHVVVGLDDSDTEQDGGFETSSSKEDFDADIEPEPLSSLFGLFSKKEQHSIVALSRHQDSRDADAQLTHVSSIDASNIQLDEVDPELLDDSDAESEPTTADSDVTSSEAEDDESEADAEESIVKSTGLTSQMLGDMPHPYNAELPSPISTADDPSDSVSPTDTTAKPSEPESVSSVENIEPDSLIPTTTASASLEPKIEVPSQLLRGTLRIYQHQGLDWLAGMYANSTNGILADEMGLGKTIQTIALLAHLAVHHNVWGPHLIIVPTSVMLNWEMEFKKWCPGFKILTYYGTIQERKQKRHGWTDDNLWNVCITSYQLALQDQAALKRRKWHFMVLDEAHNIKNWKSQRWQALLTFSTQARLLLTGTPLQNNLGELWSLLFFLAPEEDDAGQTQFSDLSKFSKMFNRPVQMIMDRGEELDDEAKSIVSQLHKVLRPHLLRRLKADVEKQMPKKYEHIVKCRLSKRQRQLYDGYMSLAGTRDSFASGNYMSIINCLMQLRKVCNHPDLFETRQIVTSYAMPKSAVADFEIKELLIRRRFLADEEDTHAEETNIVDIWQSKKPFFASTKLKTSELTNLWQANEPVYISKSSEQLVAQYPFRQSYDRLTSAGYRETSHFEGDTASISTAYESLKYNARRSRVMEIKTQYACTASRVQRRPMYDRVIFNQLNMDLHQYPRTQQPAAPKKIIGWYLNTVGAIQDMLMDVTERSEILQSTVNKFACVTPLVTAPGLNRQLLTDQGVEAIQRARVGEAAVDPFHQARVKLSIAFPDKGLIQYDCGKLQQLDKLLRRLQAGGHRALIFTQMTKVLDILEQFLNLHGHRYLRLDGSTKIDQRQILTDRFNNDTRILAFILSSRSGGLGINLTGADTVIFYDLDWNPAMDKQCQDRAHRIGQTRDVHIYRFVSEGTIEANILRKSNQKRLLDDVVIQEGDFTTDYFNRINYRDLVPGASEFDAEADAALDKVLGGGSSAPDERVLVDAEDKADAEAARRAEKEIVFVDEADFNDKEISTASGTPRAGTEAPMTPAADTSAGVAGGSHHLSTATAEAADIAMADAEVDEAEVDEAAGDTTEAEPAQQAVENEEDGAEEAAAAAAAEEEDGEPEAEAELNAGEADSFESYALRFKQWDLKDSYYIWPIDRRRKKGKATGIGKPRLVRV